MQKHRIRICTAGSVDDGKSTLIGRLLFDTKSLFTDNIAAVESKSENNTLDYSLFTDGLKAEREQKITIDVAYRYFSTPTSYFILADSPGHEQYTRNMVTAASTADCAILLIDAQKGILKQTKRHLFILTLLGIKKIAVVINKMDLVEYSQEVFQKIKNDFYQIINADNDIQIYNHNQNINFEFIPTSAINGENIILLSDKMPWYKNQTLIQYLNHIVPAENETNEFRFTVQQAIRADFDGRPFRGYLGQILSGKICVNDEVILLPSQLKSKIKSIQKFEGSLDFAQSPQSVAIEIEDNIDVSRGDMIVHTENLPNINSYFEAMLVWFSNAQLDLNKNYYIRQSSRWEKCNITEIQYKLDINSGSRIDANHLKTDFRTYVNSTSEINLNANICMNDIVRVKLQSMKPLIFDYYDNNRDSGSFVLVDYATNETVAAGMIVESINDNIKNNINNNINVNNKINNNYNHKPLIFWLTGLSAAGKSSIAEEFEQLLLQKHILVKRLDGDHLRLGLNKDLGFSVEDRKENIRRTAEVAKLFCDFGAVVIVSLISPFVIDREMAKIICGTENFIEVFIDTSIEECIKRDPKGLYRKAKAGNLPLFTGISSPYEPPMKPNVHLKTEELNIQNSAQMLFSFFEKWKIKK